MEKASDMSSVQDAISTLAGPYTGNRKGWLATAARKVKGVSHRTIKALWYGEIDREDHLAAQAVKRQAAIVAARREASDLASQYETIAGGLSARDENVYRADIAALLHAARVLRDVDRSGTEGDAK